MGRRKITIQQINDPKLRNITYNKRKNGLIKKAAEIALLCDINLLLVFEDLNGTLVQFSRDPIKNIANFPKSCNYKRVLELTADDYPDFSKIKRAKKKQDCSDEMSVQTSTTNGKKNSRSLMQMFSEHESLIDSEDVFNSDTDIRIDYETLSNQVLSTPQTLPDYSREGSSFNMSPAHLQQPDVIRKVLKTGAIKLTQSQKNKAQKDSKKRANLRLNIPKTEDAVKEAVNAVDSKGSRITSKKTGSSQKTYSRKNFDQNQKNCDKRLEFTSPPFQQMMGMDIHNPFNMGLVNLMGGSPYRDSANRKLRAVHNFMNEEETYNPVNSNPNFSELGPFGYQVVGSTPPSQRYGNRYNEEEIFTNEKIVNYLSHPGRTPPQYHNVFTFQQYEYPRNQENYSNIDHFNMIEPENNNSSKKPSYYDLPLSSGGCGKLESNISSNGMSGQRFNFDGYIFGEDRGDAYRKMKMM